MNIGKLKLDGNLVLAPMSGVTNMPFRLLCRKYGASLVYSEMVFSDGILWQNRKSTARCFTIREERPLGIQLSGPDADKLVKSALIVQERFGPELIDINLGCPAPNVIKIGAGSALLDRAGTLEEIIKRLSEALDVPLSAKMRVSKALPETLKIARMLEKAGIDALIVHGRTQKQKYSGKSSLEFIREIKKQLSIPVIANGDIIDEKTSEHVLDYTRCDGLMIGRAAIGVPYIFRKIKYYLDTGELLPPQTFEEQLNDFFEYVSVCRKYDMLSYADLKLKAQWFTKNMSGVRSVREKISRAKDVDSILGIMRDLRETIS